MINETERYQQHKSYLYDKSQSPSFEPSVIKSCNMHLTNIGRGRFIVVIETDADASSFILLLSIVLIL